MQAHHKHSFLPLILGKGEKETKTGTGTHLGPELLCEGTPHSHPSQRLKTTKQWTPEKGGGERDKNQGVTWQAVENMEAYWKPLSPE